MGPRSTDVLKRQEAKKRAARRRRERIEEAAWAARSGPVRTSRLPSQPQPG